MGVADFFGQFLVEGLCSGVLGEEGDENEEDSLHDMSRIGVARFEGFVTYELGGMMAFFRSVVSVSYTHLTLPTIYSV